MKHFNLLAAKYLVGLVILSTQFSVCPAQTLAFHQQPTTPANRATVVQLAEMLRELKSRYGVDILFADHVVRNLAVPANTVTWANSLESNLTKLLPPLGLQFSRQKGGSYVILPAQAPALVPKAEPTPVRTPETSALESHPSFRDERSGSGAIQAPIVETTIRGTVTAEDGNEPLPGVSILLKGTSRGTTTDGEGRYEIAVPDANAVLVFSFIGYLNQEVTVGNRTSIAIQLKPDTKALEEVVVVGYGTQRKASLTAAVTQITSRDIQNQVVNNPLNAMAGQMAGVSIAQGTGKPGANPVVRIRGTGSISASNAPLYVVDGVPLQSGDDISLLNPNDIESIDVLKDAASAAIYGSRGGNGVVIITTKKGKAGQAKIDFNFYTGVQKVSKKVDIMNRDEHIDFIKEVRYTQWVVNSGMDPNVPNGQRILPNGTSLNYPASYDNPSTVPDTDWQDEIFQAAPISNYQLSAQGGTDKVRYFVSGNYFSQDGIVRSTDFKRFAGRLNLEANLTSKFKIGINLSPSYAKENRLNTDGHWAQDDGGIISTALIMPPTVQARYENGLYGQIAGEQDFIQNGYAGAIFTPLQKMDDPNFINLEQRSRMLGNTYAELELVKGLVVRSSLGLDYRNYWTDYYRPSTVGVTTALTVPVLTPGNPNPNLTNIASNHTEFRNINYSWENTATYNRTFNEDHALTLLAGYSVQKNTDESQTLTGQSGQFSNDLVTNVRGASIINGNYNQEEWSLLSYFGRVNYAFRNKYLLSAALRRDGSSRFASNNKWALFPSASVGWRISEESFLKSNRLISDLKIRASYGVTGNFNIGNYRWRALLTSSNYNFGAGEGSIANGYALSNFLNPDLTWETNNQTDIGLDVGILQNRVSLSLDLYRRVTDGLLYTLPIPAVSGFTTTYGNLGTIENKGIELEIHTVNANKAFRWTTDFNFSLNRNVVLKLGANDEPIVSTYEATAVQVTEVGKPFAQFFGYKTDGIFLTQADADANPGMKLNPAARAGDVRFVDTNGDGVITPEDRVPLGNPTPDFIYGMTNRFSYKNFDLDIQLQGVQGGKILFNQARFSGLGSIQFNNLSRLNDRWRSEEDPGDGFPRWGFLNQGEALPSLYLQDGTYLRVRNVTLGYNLPSAVAQKVRLSNVRLYATGQNLFTFTKYLGYNPEVNIHGENVTRPGIDYGVYPLARSIIFGINIGI